MKIDYDVGDVVSYIGPTVPGVTRSNLRVGSLHRVRYFTISHGDTLCIKVDANDGIVTASSFKKLPKADTGFTSLIKRKAAPKRVPENA